MKRLALGIISLLLLTGCSNKVQPDTPSSAAFLMKYHIDNQNYLEFQSLFFEGAEGNVSKEMFKELDDLSTAGASYQTLELVTFENGEMLLVEFAAKTDDEEIYKIGNVYKVPEEMKALFIDK